MCCARTAGNTSPAVRMAVVKFGRSRGQCDFVRLLSLEESSTELLNKQFAGWMAAIGRREAGVMNLNESRGQWQGTKTS